MRAAVAAVAAVAVVACSTGPTPVAPKSAEIAHPWPMFRGTAQHVGDFSARAAPAGKLRWRVELGERVDASAVVDIDGRVYVATRKGRVVVLDLATGKRLGQSHLGGSLWASPALVGDTLVVASGSGHLIGVDRRTLKERWRRTAGAKSFSGLTIWRGRVYLCAGRKLIELEPASGRIRRSVDLGSASFTAPAISADGKAIVVGSRRGAVHAFDLATFERRWQSRAAKRTDGSPTIADGRVFIGSDDNRLYAFDLATGRKLWTSAGDDWVVSNPAVYAGRVYFGDDGGVLRAADVGTGELRWTRKVGGDLASAPTVVGERLIHGAHDGKIWLWDATTGEPAAEPIAVGASMYASPAVGPDGSVVLSTHRGAVVAVE